VARVAARAGDTLKLDEYNGLCELVDDAVLVYDPRSGLIFDVNEGACETYGIPREAFVGRSVADLWVEVGREDRHLHTVISEGTCRGFETVHRRGDGAPIDVTINSSLIEFEGRRAVLSVSRRGEARLRETEERYRSLVEHIPAVVYIQEIEHEGAISYISPQIKVLMGYSSEEYVQDPGLWVRTTHPDDRERVLEEDRRTDQTGELFSIEFRKVRRDGNVIWVRDEAVLVRDAKGHPLYWQGIFTDITERKRTEEALLENERRFRQLFENSADALFVHDDRGRFVDCNVEACRVLGYAREEVLSLSVADVATRLISEEERREGETLWERALGSEPGRIVGFDENELRRKDGTTFPVEVGIGAIEYGGRRRIFAAARDVTERKRAAAALIESEERFRSLVQNATEITTILGPDGTIYYESPAIERTLGYHPEELVGESAWDYIHPDDLEVILATWAEALGGGGASVRREFRFRHKDGSWRWLEGTGRDLRADPGVQAVMVTSRDITERKEAREALKESEAKYRTLVEQIPAVTYIEALDEGELDWNMLYVSPQVEQLLGYTPEEYVADPKIWQELLHPDDQQRVLSEDARTEESGEPFSVEYRIFRRDGTVAWIRDEATLVWDEEGRPLFWQGVMHDVTDRKRSEERLRSTIGSLLALHEAGRILSSTLEREEIASWLLEIMQRIAGYEAAVIDLNDEQHRLRPWRTVGPEGLWRLARSTPEAQAARRKVLETGERQLFRLRRPGGVKGVYLVGLYLPLLVRARLVGILEVYGSDAVSGQETVETIASLAGQAASALENARLYGELAERERRLRDLVGRVLAAQEEERRRVAYEIHDGLAQTAAAAHQLLQVFVRHHAPGWARDQRTLDRALELVQRTVGEARQVISDLRPTTLDDFGLATAIRQQVERLGGEDCRIEYEEKLGGMRLPNAIETALYRVAQEALTNVYKHSRTGRVRVALQQVNGSVSLRVRDWGEGFDPDEVTCGSGPGERVGLSSMRERISLLGGSFEIYSEPGAGTEVVASVPLPEEHTGHG